jgi:hypothetical protein
MELDIIILRDGLYSLHPIKVELKNMMDCFDYCDVLREQLTTYLEHINRHVMINGGGFFFGCVCR